MSYPRTVSILKKIRPKLFTLHSSLFTLMMSLLIISGCGYRPVSKEARVFLPDPVYVDVKLSGVEPQNGVYLKEEILRVLMTRFHEKTVSDASAARSRIEVPSYHFSYSPLTYDKNGYVIRYRVGSSITFQVTTPKEKVQKVISTSEDVNIQPGSLTSSAARDAAIRVAIRKAMDKWIAYVAQKGVGK